VAHTFTPSTEEGRRGRWSSEFKTSLVCRGTRRTARATQRNCASKNKTKQNKATTTKKKTKKQTQNQTKTKRSYENPSKSDRLDLIKIKIEAPIVGSCGVLINYTNGHTGLSVEKLQRRTIKDTKQQEFKTVLNVKSMPWCHLFRQVRWLGSALSARF